MPLSWYVLFLEVRKDKREKCQESFMNTGKAAVGELVGLKVGQWAKGQAIKQTSYRTKQDPKLQKVTHNCFQDFIVIATLLSLSPPCFRQSLRRRVWVWYLWPWDMKFWVGVAIKWWI